MTTVIHYKSKKINIKMMHRPNYLTTPESQKTNANPVYIIPYAESIGVNFRYIETPYTFVINAHKSQVMFEFGLFGTGEFDSHIQGCLWIQQWDNLR